MLKRKLEETAGEGEGTETTSNGQSESDDSNCSAGSTDALAPEGRPNHFFIQLYNFFLKTNIRANCSKLVFQSHSLYYST